MKLATGNMFDHPASLILVTTNSYVRDNGTLVMGRGAAAELRRHMPNAESVFGALVKKSPGLGVWKQYGVLVEPMIGDWTQLLRLRKPQLGIFQVKYHWGKPAVPELISHSVSSLISIAHNYQSISLNYPGIGNGGLTRGAVWPLIKGLPNNCTVWVKE